MELTKKVLAPGKHNTWRAVPGQCPALSRQLDDKDNLVTSTAAGAGRCLMNAQSYFRIRFRLCELTPIGMPSVRCMNCRPSLSHNLIILNRTFKKQFAYLRNAPLFFVRYRPGSTRVVREQKTEELGT